MVQWKGAEWGIPFCGRLLTVSKKEEGTHGSFACTETPADPGRPAARRCGRRADGGKPRQRAKRRDPGGKRPVVRTGVRAGAFAGECGRSGNARCVGVVYGFRRERLAEPQRRDVSGALRRHRRKREGGRHEHAHRARAAVFRFDVPVEPLSVVAPRRRHAGAGPRLRPARVYGAGDACGGAFVSGVGQSAARAIKRAAAVFERFKPVERLSRGREAPRLGRRIRRQQVLRPRIFRRARLYHGRRAGDRRALRRRRRAV